MKICALAVFFCVAALAGSAQGGIAAGKTSLVITVMPNGAKPSAERHTYTLRCGPAGGTLAHAAAACAKLAKIQKPFAPVPKDMACTEIYGGPQVALVTGLHDGRSVWTKFTRVDGCQIARWNRVKFLFPR